MTKMEKLKKKIKELEKEEQEEIMDYVADLVESDCRSFKKGNFNSSDLKREFGSLKSVWSAESRIRTWATIKILEELEDARKKGGRL